MKRFLFILALLFSNSAYAQSQSCTKVLNLYTGTTITGDDTGSFIVVPEGIEHYYLRMSATETSAGGATATVLFNETASETNAATLHAFALTVSAETRVLDTATSGSFDYLGPYVYVDVTSVTGTWEITVDLVYCR